MSHFARIRSWFLCAGLAALSLGLTAPARAADDGVARVVYHADFSDPRRFSAMLTSIHNMVSYYENQLLEYDVRIVFVAHGIRFVTDDALQSTPFAADAAIRGGDDDEAAYNLRALVEATLYDSF